MNKSLFLAAFCAASMVLTGCNKTVAERETRASQALASGNLDQAKRELEAAQSTAAKENAPQDVRERLATQLADVNQRLDVRRKGLEDDARAAAAAALQAAKADVDRRDWKQLMRDMDTASSQARKANDPALNAEIDRMMRSQPMALMRARAAYREVCSKAGWATGFAIFELPGTFWMELSSYSAADQRLEQAAAATGDTELTAAGRDVSENWRQYMHAKKLAEATSNSNSVIGGIISIGSSISAGVNAIQYGKAQTRFEKRMNELLGATTMPAPTYTPARREQPAPWVDRTPPNVTTSAPRAPSTSSSVPAGVPVAPSTTASVTPPPTSTPASPVSNTQVDRSTPNFEDLSTGR